MLPQHCQHLLGPRQKCHSPVAQPLHGRGGCYCPITSHLRRHFLTMRGEKDKPVTYSDTLRRRPAGFALKRDEYHWREASFSAELAPCFPLGVLVSSRVVGSPFFHLSYSCVFWLWRITLCRYALALIHGMTFKCIVIGQNNCQSVWRRGLPFVFSMIASLCVMLRSDWTERMSVIC